MRADPHGELFKRLYNDRLLAHEVLFRHRHGHATKAFHKAIIADWHDNSSPRVVDLAFRGSAKSTIAEEAICIRAGFREFRNGLVIGENYDRAAERLHAIKHELDSNDKLAELFGPLHGPTWGDGEIILSNGTRILALGRGQALRGIKFEDIRPDAIFCDDIETNLSVNTEEGRRKSRVWFFTELLPACAPDAFVRVAATPLDPRALAVKLISTKGWVAKIFPIEFLNAEGEREATWPERFSLKWIDEQAEIFRSTGLYEEFEREYMCSVEAKSSRIFSESQFRVEPVVRTWQPVYAMFDPARTTAKTSAMTGFASWSWVGDKLIVWDAWGERILPDEIINRIFKVGLDEALPPVWIGIEEDGLNEFLLQPIRQEQVRRGESIPFRAMKAPKGKIDFISGLQPFAKEGRIVFTKDFLELKTQLLTFPKGVIDIPNALAYALKLRPGLPIYENFGARHLFEDLERVRSANPYLAIHATRSLLAAALVQYWDNTLYVLSDWMREGSPAENLKDVVASAQIAAGRKVTVTLPPFHYEQYSNVGLVQACARVPVAAQRATPPHIGAQSLSAFLRQESRGFPCLRVSSHARWTLNAFAGGYTRNLKNGVLTEAAEEGPYRLLMEAIESFAGLTDAGSLFDEEEDMHYDVTRAGTRYVSARR